MNGRTLVPVVAGVLAVSGVGWWLVFAGGAKRTGHITAPVARDEVAAAAAPVAAKVPGMIPIPEDAVEAAAVMGKVREDLANVQVAAAAKAAEIARRRLDSWEGCRFTPGVKRGEPGYNRHKDVADRLSAMEAIPKERADCFEWATKIAAMPCRLIGWQGQVVRVTDCQDGAIVEALVRPVLVKEGTGSGVATWSAARETWKMDATGNLTLDRVELQGYKGLAGL